MKKILIASLLAVALPLAAQEQKTTEDKNAKNVFTTIKEVGRTSIKNQANSGTCWSYSGQGFFEEELLRMGKTGYDLSEMFVVSHSYRDKARKYIRLDGHLNFEQGGSFYDVLYVLKHYGAVPRAVMTGLNYGTKNNQHNELAAVMKAYLKALLAKPNGGKLSTAWQNGLDGILDSYLGKLPETFRYNGKSYTPKSYAAELGINPDDYVSLTSYTHHPFYTKFALEIPDNWRWAESYNLPIDELMEVMDKAIDNGYSFAWGADVTEKGFTRDGIGVLVDLEEMNNKGSDFARWFGSEGKSNVTAAVHRADVPEIEPTQEYRQMGYDNKELTDDHGMTIYGKAVNQNGRKFFIVKNSWGEAGAYKGVWYVSYNYAKGRTMNILIHKNAIPKAIAKKLGL